MKVTWKIDKYDVEVEGNGQVEVFDELGVMIELLSNSRCGACDSGSVVPRTRESGEYKFREMFCQSCGCTLQFGQRRSDGSLFPKRNDKENKRLPNGGWSKYQPREESQQKDVPW